MVYKMKNYIISTPSFRLYWTYLSSSWFNQEGLLQAVGSIASPWEFLLPDRTHMR